MHLSQPTWYRNMDYTVITFNEEDLGDIMVSLRETRTAFYTDGSELAYLNFEEVPIPYEGATRFVMKMSPWDSGHREMEFVQIGVLITMLDSVNADFQIDYMTELEFKQV